MKREYEPIEPAPLVSVRMPRLRPASLLQTWAMIALALSPLTYLGFVTMRQNIRTMTRYRANPPASRYEMLWDSPWGGDRARMSMPLRERERRIFDRVLADARAKGFVFRDPMATQTTAEGDALEPSREGRRTYGTAYPSGRVLLSTEDMDRMDDSEVCVLEAHEVGHQVDMQTERMGHSFLYRFRNADSETLAWEFAGELCGAQTVAVWRKKWQIKWHHYVD